MTRCIFAFLLMLTPTAARAPEAVSAKSFGAKGDGQADDTHALQRAIEMGQQRQVPVHVARGRYRVTKPLVIKGQLLKGLEAGGWNADAMPMPQLIVDHRNGPVMKMEDAASVHGIAFVYHRAKPEGKEDFGPAILLAGNGLSVTNIRVQYPDDAIMADGTTNIGRTNLENIFIVQPRGTGVYISQTLDIATIRNVEVWCPGKMQPGPAFRLGHNDELRMLNCFAFNCQVGYQFEGEFTKDKRTGSYGTLTDCATDACSIGYRIKGWASLNITSGDFWNHHQGFEVDHPEAEIRICNADLRSNGAPALLVKQAKSVIVNGCRFNRAFANADIVSASFNKVGMLTVNNCQFGAFGPCIELAGGVKQAVIANNIFEPSPHDRIRDRTNGKTEVSVTGNVGMNPTETKKSERTK